MKSGDLIRYEKTGGFRVKTLKGPVGVARSEITLTVCALGPGGYGRVKAIRDAIKGDPPGTMRLDGYRGTLGAHTVQICRVESDTDSYEGPPDGGDAGLFEIPL